MTLELTTRFRGITTSSAAKRGGLSRADAVGLSMSNLRYITRDSASPEVVAAASGKPVTATPDEWHTTVRGAVRDAVEARADRGGSRGSRVAERVTISVPNSWPDDAVRDALADLTGYFSPPGSEALAVGSWHKDKPQNQHLHFLVVDGREAKTSAEIRAAGRAGEGKERRVRRRDVHRFNDGGRPKEIRRDIARLLNDIAREHGLERVEWRSFKARGMAQEPSKHRGPAADAKNLKAGAALDAGRQMWDGGECAEIDRAPPRRAAQKAPEQAETPRHIPQPTTTPQAPPVAQPRKVFRGGRWMTITDPSQHPDAPLLKPQRERSRDRGRER